MGLFVVVVLLSTVGDHCVETVKKVPNKISPQDTKPPVRETTGTNKEYVKDASSIQRNDNRTLNKDANIFSSNQDSGKEVNGSQADLELQKKADDESSLDHGNMELQTMSRQDMKDGQVHQENNILSRDINSPASQLENNMPDERSSEEQPNSFKKQTAGGFFLSIVKLYDCPTK